MKVVKSRNFPIFIFFVLLTAILAVNSNSIKSFLKKAPITAEVDKTRKIEPPVSLNNRNVNNAYLAYTFFGPIKETKKLSAGTEIILETSEKDLPQFIVDQDVTKIFKFEENKNIIGATIEDLRKGARVSISTTYDLKTHLWITRTVHIVD